MAQSRDYWRFNMAGFQNKPKDEGNIRIPDYSAGQTAIAKELSKSAGMRLEYRAVLGDVVPDTNSSRYYISDEGDEPSALGTISKVGIPKEFLKTGQRIRVRKNASGNFEYIGLDTDTAEIFNEGDVGSIDQTPISQSQFDFAVLQPYSALVATVKGAIYGDDAVIDLSTADFSASPLDTDSNPIDIPTTANRAIGVLVQLDPSSSTLSYKQSTQFNAAISLTTAYAQGLLPLRDTGKKRLGYLKLSNGIAQFDYGSVWTCPEWFPKIIEVTGGSSTDNAIARWDGSSGTLLQDSFVYIDDDGNLTGVNSLSFNSSVALTIDSGGAIVPTSSWHRVDTFASAASDNLDTITWTPDLSTVLLLRIEDASRSVVIRHNGGGTGNIRTMNGLSISLTATYQIVLLFYDNNTNLWSAIAVYGSIGGSTGAIDNSIIRADGTGGSTVQAGSSVTLSDAGVVAGMSFSTDGNYFSFGGILEIPIDASGINSPNVATARNFAMRANTGTSDDFLGYSGDFPIGTLILYVAKAGHTITMIHADATATNKFYLTSGANYVLKENNPIVFQQRASNILAEIDTSGSGGGFSNFILTADSGTNQTVDDGETVDIEGGTNIATVVGATNKVTVGITGQIAIANGGTGQATQTAAFDALAPTTTNGDIIYYNGGDNLRLAIGSAGQVLKVVSGIPAWAANEIITIYTKDVVTNQTTSSTSYGDVTNTNISHSFTKSKALIIYQNLILSNSAGGNNTIAQITLAGATATGAPEVFNVGATARQLAIAGEFTGISAGSQTVRLQMKVTAGTGTLSANASLIIIIIEHD